VAWSLALGVRRTIVEETDVGQISGLRHSLLQLIKGFAALHDPVALTLGVTEKIDLVFAARGGVRLGLEVAATASEKDVDLRAERVRVADLVLGNLFVGVAVRHVSDVASRSGMVNGGCHDQSSLEALALCGFEDRAYGLTIVVDSDG
jgi:hypothetical protein